MCRICARSHMCMWHVHAYTYIYAKIWCRYFLEHDHLIIAYPCASQTSVAVNVSVNFTIEYIIRKFEATADEMDLEHGDFTITTGNILCKYFIHVEQWWCLPPTTCVHVKL